MYTCHTLHSRDRRIETVGGWESLDEVVAAMAATSWEEPSNYWVSYVTDATGEAVALGLFGLGLDLLVVVADGRQLRFPMPERYRAA